MSEVKVGLKDHQIRELVNATRDGLKERIPSLRDYGALRDIISGVIGGYLEDNNLALDYPSKEPIKNAVIAKDVPKCCVCETTKNLRKDGWYGYRCDSEDCVCL